MRREWIEIFMGIIKAIPQMSPSMRREWIEMTNGVDGAGEKMSPSMRREWIEIRRNESRKWERTVSLHAEGVD